MGKKPRIHVPGGIYHVILQGNNGESLFREDQDHVYFHDLLGEGGERFDHTIHALCSMTNHIHLAPKVRDDPLKRIVHHCCLKYAKWFNRKYERKGHLFKSPYKAILVDKQSYLLELIRYIHLNPVRAGIVERPEDYRWSSYRAYLGEGCPDWLSVDWVLSLFGSDVRQARLRFQKFIHAGIGEPESESPTIEMNDVIEQVCQISNLQEYEIRSSGRQRRVSDARALCALVARDLKVVTLKEMTRYFNQTVAALSKSSLNLLDRASSDPQVAAKIEEVKRALAQK